MQPVETRPHAVHPPGHAPASGRASPHRFAPAPGVTGDAPPVDGVDQDFEEFFFE